MLAQLRGLAPRPVEKARLVSQNIACGIYELLRARFLKPKEDRLCFIPWDVAQSRCIKDAFKNPAIAAIHRLVHCILEANAAITITRSIETRKHFELHVLVATRFLHNVSFESVENTRENRPD